MLVLSVKWVAEVSEESWRYIAITGKLICHQMKYTSLTLNLICDCGSVVAIYDNLKGL